MRFLAPLFAAGAVAAMVGTVGTVARGQRDTIGVDEVHPGMRGHGLTVFRGTEVERFDVEVIDVMRNFQPGQDLILIRTDHPVLERASSVAGMSGSPIYLGGRLAGAYAYGWPFGEEPIAGVTPIANMLAELDRPVRPGAFPGAELLPGAQRRARAGADTPPARLAGLDPYLGGRRGALAPLGDLVARRDPTGDAPGLRPAVTPLVLGGMTARMTRVLGDALAPFGLLPLQGGGGGRAAGAATGGYEAGGAIGVQLIRGDVAATAIGTVTHVAGRRLVAFGHPMMNTGESGLPTSRARVLHVLVNERRSFKLGEAGAPLGTLIHDRQAAIVVDSELQARTVPVSLRLRGVPGAPKTTWDVEVVDHRVLTPLLTFAAIGNALSAVAADQAEIRFRARSRVKITGRPPIELVDERWTAGGPADTRALASLRLFSLMEAAYGNPFEEARIERVDLELDVRFTREFLRIVDVSAGVDEVDPGETVDLRVVTRRFGAPDRVHVVPFRVPERAAGQKIRVEVEAADEVDVERPRPRDLDDLVQRIEAQLPATAFAVSVGLDSRGLQFDGHVVRALPASALDALQLANDARRIRPFVTFERSLVDAGDVVTGKARVDLRVRERPRG